MSAEDTHVDVNDDDDDRCDAVAPPHPPPLPPTISATPEACMYDSQGNFACPGSEAYRKAWSSQEKAEACRTAWHDRWIKVGGTPCMTYGMGYTSSPPRASHEPHGCHPR